MVFPKKKTNTIISYSGMLFLKTEIQQHFTNNFKMYHNTFLQRIKRYIFTLKKQNIPFFMFIIPDKSIICQHLLPPKFKKKGIQYRMCNWLQNYKCVIDLIQHYPFTERDYFVTDSHMNYEGALGVTQKIIYILTHSKVIDKIENTLKFSVIPRYLGDLTEPINLPQQELINQLNIRERVIEINNTQYSGYISKLDLLDPKYLKHHERPTKYVENKKAPIKKKLLIFGDSSTDCLIFKLITWYFKETIFYWNHMNPSLEFIHSVKPDILIDIRTERFLCIPSDLEF